MWIDFARVVKWITYPKIAKPNEQVCLPYDKKKTLNCTRNISCLHKEEAEANQISLNVITRSKNKKMETILENKED